MSVVTSYPLDRILHNREATGRVVEWAIELGEFNLDFISSHAVKSRALADFVAEWTPVSEHEEEDPQACSVPGVPGHWTLHFDGSLMLKGAGAGVVLTSPTGEELQYVVQLLFRATNNMAEYEGLLAGLLAKGGS